MCARVLVVDDDPINADLLGYLLRASGHEPVLTFGGTEALREMASHPPDLVLCDIQMPDVDGFEVLRRMRGERRFDATRIVGVTALAMVGDREKVLAAGFDGYLTKPIAPETFIAEIEKYLPAAVRRAAALPVEIHTAPSQPAIPTARWNSTAYVLVVDDLEANVQLMRHILGAMGVDVRAARNATDAVRLARAARPSLIISDIHMPGPSGIDLLEQVKADAELRDVPFLLISASDATADERRRAVGGGADGLLLRPLDAEEILLHLSRWIPREPAA